MFLNGTLNIAAISSLLQLNLKINTIRIKAAIFGTSLNNSEVYLWELSRILKNKRVLIELAWTDGRTYYKITITVKQVVLAY